MPFKIFNRFLLGGSVLFSILLIGTIGYWYFGEKQYSIIDCLYMTVITITTILNELHTTGRKVVVIDNDEVKLSNVSDMHPDVSYINGDADIEEVLYTLFWQIL